MSIISVENESLIRDVNKTWYVVSFERSSLLRTQEM